MLLNRLHLLKKKTRRRQRRDYTSDEDEDEEEDEEVFEEFEEYEELEGDSSFPMVNNLLPFSEPFICHLIDLWVVSSLINAFTPEVINM